MTDITDEQLRELRISFARKADHYHAAMCAAAQGDEFSATTMAALTEAQRRQIYGMKQPDARARCATLMGAR